MDRTAQCSLIIISALGCQEHVLLVILFDDAAFKGIKRSISSNPGRVERKGRGRKGERERERERERGQRERSH